MADKKRSGQIRRGSAEHTHTRKAAELRPVKRSPRRQLFLLLTAVPMVAGLVLIIAAGFDLTLRGSPDQQAVAGAMLILFGFAASNAGQGLWILATGWLLLALAAGARYLAPASWGVPFSYALIAAGGSLLIFVFAQRLRAAGQARRGRR